MVKALHALGIFLMVTFGIFLVIAFFHMVQAVGSPTQVDRPFSDLLFFFGLVAGAGGLLDLSRVTSSQARFTAVFAFVAALLTLAIGGLALLHGNREFAIALAVAALGCFSISRAHLGPAGWD